MPSSLSSTETTRYCHQAREQQQGITESKTNKHEVLPTITHWQCFFGSTWANFLTKSCCWYYLSPSFEFKSQPSSYLYKVYKLTNLQFLLLLYYHYKSVKWYLLCIKTVVSCSYFISSRCLWRRMQRFPLGLIKEGIQETKQKKLSQWCRF